MPPPKKKARRRRNKQELYDLSACYSGCMLGVTLSVTVFEAYADDYDKHRRRMTECLEGYGAAVTLPLQQKEFIAGHDAILEAVQSELERVSRPCLGWMLFGTTLITFAVKKAFRSPEAREPRRALVVFLDKLGLPRTIVSRLSRKCRTEKDGKLSLFRLHSAALAALNEIMGSMRRDARTAFVAMPFSVPRMAGRYEEFYAPLLKNLDFKPLRAWGGFETEEYQDLLYTLIDRCGTMLADLTTLNPNVMHEVGYTLGKGSKFVILLAEEGENVPANLGDLTVLTYRAEGTGWQTRTAAEIAATVALYLFAASSDSDRRSGRIVGPMKVTE